MIRKLGLLLACALGLSACPSPVAPAAPTPPAASQVLDTQSTTVIEGNGEPLVVDWKPHQRGDLEVAMKEGVAIVAFDTHGLKLLRDCHVDGTYGFIGMTTKQQMVRLESADELRANLPLSGGVLAARLGGEMARGLTVDIAMVMIGKMRTTWRSVSPSDLKGACTGATHFVRGATVGAFAMDTGSKARARVVAELFGAGVAGGGSNAQSMHNEDGSLSDCGKAVPDSGHPPAQCGALLRLELAEVTQSTGGKADKVEAPGANVQVACPPNMRMVEGKCAAAAAAVASAACDYGSQACVSACVDKSDAESCLKLGVMSLQGQGVPKSIDNAGGALIKACDRGAAKACGILGDLIVQNKKDYALASRVWAKGCNDGDEGSCGGIGTMFLTGMGGERDVRKAVPLLTRSCDGGNHEACSNLGVLFLGGNGVNKDLQLSARLFKSACDGASGVGCSNFAYMVEFGQGGVTKDLQRAWAAYVKACQLDTQTCLWVGAQKQIGKATTKDDGGAMAAFKTSCGAGNPTACALLKAYVDPSVTVDTKELARYGQLFLGTCKEGISRDCTQAAIYAMALGNKSDGEQFVKLACKAGDDWACVLQNFQVK